MVCLVLGVVAGEVSWSRKQAVQPATAPVEKSSVSVGRWAPPGQFWRENTRETNCRRLRSAIQSQLDQIESTFSLYQSDSALSRFNRDPSGVMNAQSPAGLVAVTQRAIDLSRRSRGAFDPRLAHYPGSGSSGNFPLMASAKLSCDRCSAAEMRDRPARYLRGPP